MAAAFSVTSLSAINVRRRTRTSSSPIHSSLSKNDNTSSSPSPSPPKPQPRTPPRPQLQKQRKPSLAQIERAIGAGEFRDRNTNRDSGEPDKSLLDVVLSKTIEREENDLEKKLREIGEWLIDRTEGNPVSGTAGKKNLVTTSFRLLIPIWILAFFVASGILKLPFSSPLIDDLIM